MHLNTFAGIHLYGVSGGAPVDIASRYLWFHKSFMYNLKRSLEYFTRVF